MDPDRPRYDAIVVGARAAGAATAMLLARQGRRVLVVDRSRHGADTLSTHALMRAGVLQLSRWGLLDRIVDAGTPPVRQVTFRYRHGQVVVPIKASPGVDALYAPRRTVLDPILVDAATAAGAEVRYGITVTGVRRQRHGAVTGVVGRDERGRPFAADAAIVIGADGRRSTVADLVRAPTERRGVGTTAVVYGYWSGLATDGYEWIFTANGSAGVIPTNDGQACVFVGGTPSRIGRGGVEVMHDVLADVAPGLAARLAGATTPTGVRTFPGRPGHMRRCWGPGWALVGDAGYWKDPISVHGLTDAMRDAELLALALSSSEADGPDRSAALAGYQATRDVLSTRLFDVTDVIAQQRWTDEEIPGILLELSAAMADELQALAALDDVSVAMPAS
jgi:2-polyprenyl-6-methoxyphenol hydroxylase-like FAD-dependent oxidoreductase